MILWIKELNVAFLLGLMSIIKVVFVSLWDIALSDFRVYFFLVRAYILFYLVQFRQLLYISFIISCIFVGCFKLHKLRPVYAGRDVAFTSILRLKCILDSLFSACFSLDTYSISFSHCANVCGFVNSTIILNVLFECYFFFEYVC